MAERRTQIAAFGGVYLDIKAGGFHPEAAFTPDKLPMGGSYETVPGGSVLNFARASSKLNLPTMFMGKVGNDLFGHELTRRLKQDPNITPLLKVSPDVSTNVGIHFVLSPGQEVRSGIGTANQSLTMGDVTEALGEYLPQASHVYLGGMLKLPHLLPELARFAKAAQSLGVKVILDHGRVASSVSEQDISYIQNILPYVDYYLPSREEFLQVWGVPSLAEGAEKVRSLTRATIVIKDAENGAFGVTETGRLLHVPTFDVPVIDTVGAGDTFNAGFIKAQTLGLNLPDSIRYANAVASLKISQEESPTEEEVMAFIERQTITQMEKTSVARRASL